MQVGKNLIKSTNNLIDLYEKNNSLAIFEAHKIRCHYDEKTETWYFSVIDVVGALIEQSDFKKAKSYWTTLKNRLKDEGSQLVTNCDQLKLQSNDGKFYKTDVANVETILRLIQSVPKIGTDFLFDRLAETCNIQI